MTRSACQDSAHETICFSIHLLLLHALQRVLSVRLVCAGEKKRPDPQLIPPGVQMDR